MAPPARAAVRALGGELIEVLKSLGITVYELTDAERNSFKSSVAGIQAEIVKELGGESQKIYDLLLKGKEEYKKEKIMKKFISVLDRAQRILAGLSIFLLSVFIILDILGREVFSQGFPWAQKLSVYLMIWAGFLGSSITNNKGAHLRPEIADKLWPESMKEYFIEFVMGSLLFFVLWLLGTLINMFKSQWSLVIRRQYLMTFRYGLSKSLSLFLFYLWE